MIAKTQRWLDNLLELSVLRLVGWVWVAVTTYPGVLQNPWKLANWFDDHSLYAFDEVDRVSLLKYHQLPAWNPYWCGGATGISEPEDSFYSPDFVLRLLFGGEHGRRLAVMLLVVAGLEGTYRLCRRLDSTAVASAFAAVVFATQDKFVSFVHDGWVHFMSFELIPWLLLALLNGIDQLRWRVIGGFFLAWLVLAPGTYPAPYGAIAFGFWFVAIAAYRFFKLEPRPFRGPLLSAFTIGGIAILLTLCKLLPVTLYMREFPRVFTVVETHTAVEMIGQMVPRYYVIVLLAIIGAIFADLYAGLAIGGTLLFFLLCLGEFPPISPFGLMKKLPLLSALRYPDRFIVMVVFFCSIAASRGLSRMEDVLPKFLEATWRWLESLDLRARVKRLTGKDIKALATVTTPRDTRILGWIAVGLAAYISYKTVAPVAEELSSAQRAPSIALYTEEPVRKYDGEFKQTRGNRRDSHIFPSLNMGSLNCVVGFTIPESARLRADLPQEEYPADPKLAKVKRVSWSPNEIVLDVDASAPTTILVNQNWARQWRSDVGAARSEEGLLAIDVPAGKHTVTLAYRDYVVIISFWISFLTVLVIAGLTIRALIPWVKQQWSGFNSLPSLPSNVVAHPIDLEGPPEPLTPFEKVRADLRLFDFSRLPDTKAGWIARILVTVIAVSVLVQRTRMATAPLIGVRRPAAIATADIEGYRFRIPDETRHAIFDEIAAAELAERDRAIKANTWNGHQWSREDDRGYYERIAVRSAAAKHKVSIAQVYLVLDEGIHDHWPAPNGEPLPATTPPLSLRTTW